MILKWLSEKSPIVGCEMVENDSTAGDAATKERKGTLRGFLFFQYRRNKWNVVDNLIIERLLLLDGQTGHAMPRMKLYFFQEKWQILPYWEPCSIQNYQQNQNYHNNLPPAGWLVGGRKTCNIFRTNRKPHERSCSTFMLLGIILLLVHFTQPALLSMDYSARSSRPAQPLPAPTFRFDLSTYNRKRTFFFMYYPIAVY